MRTQDASPGRNRAGHLAGPILAWTVWAAMTVALVLYVRQDSRNVPFMDDFALVPMMTGQQPVSLEWAWSQHNEHRPLISRLILAGLSRFVANDFRTGRYFNVGLLSSAAASMLLLARRLRGSTRVTDAVLPLSILNVGQSESLMIAFAMNLILSAWISFELIAAVSLAGRRPGWSTALRFSLLLVALPLSGGSGLVMLPPLMAWLAGYVAWGWWSRREPGGGARAFGLTSLMACSAIVVLYFSGYVKPGHHPPAPSIAAAASTTLEFLSLALCPNVPEYGRPAGLLLSLLVAATMLRLAVIAVRQPEERLRASGLMAILLSMLSLAAAVGLSRSGFGPGAGVAARYVTLTAPLLAALYMAWLACGPGPARRWIHVGLLALACLTVPSNVASGLRYGTHARVSERRVERNLRDHVPASVVMERACPAIYPDPKVAYEFFKMLKAARFRAFRSFNEDRTAGVPIPPTTVRR